MANQDDMSIYDVLSVQQKSNLQSKIKNTQAKIAAIIMRTETGGSPTLVEEREIKNLKNLVRSYKQSIAASDLNAQAKRISDKVKTSEKSAANALADEDRINRKRALQRHDPLYNPDKDAKRIEEINNDARVKQQRAKQDKDYADKTQEQATKENKRRALAARKAKDTNVSEEDWVRNKKETVAKSKAGYSPGKYNASEYDVPSYTKSGASEYDAQNYNEWRKAIKKDNVSMLKKTTPSKTKKFKFPAKNIARTGVGAGIGMTLSSFADDYHDDNNIASSRIGNGLDLLSPMGGYGALGAGAMLANEGAVNKLRSMYDPYGSEGLSRTALYKKYMADIGGATTDKVATKKNKVATKLNRLKERFGAAPNTEAKIKRAEQAEQLIENKKDRWTNRPVVEAEDAKLKQIERDRLARELDSRSKSVKLSEAGIGPRDTAMHNSIRNNINTRINDLRASLQTTEFSGKDVPTAVWERRTYCRTAGSVNGKNINSP